MELASSLVRLAPTPERPLLLVTGAGMSAASGIPTFRGPEGYWTVGSRVYRPMDLATRAAFERMPREVWRWYLYRRGVCGRAQPNAGHLTVAALEASLGDAFRVITQNVDGLHVRAGNTPPRVLEIHGNTDFMRDLSTGERLPVPAGLEVPHMEAPLTDAMWAQLVNPETGARCRPHVLWFDEYYDEANFRAESALELALRASAVITCGTSGAASLPWRIVEAAFASGGLLADISIEDNPFRDAARQAARVNRGAVFEGSAVDGLGVVAEALGVSADVGGERLP